MPSSSLDRTPPCRPPVTVHRSAWLAVLVVGAACALLADRASVSTGDPVFAPTAVLLGSAVVPAAFLTFVGSRRLGLHVGGWAIGACVVVGGVLGTVVAGSLEADVQRAGSSLGPAGVAVVEEASKLLVPLVVLLVRRGWRTRADGLLLGVAAGAGFAVLETMGHAYAVLLQTSDDVSGTVHLLVARGVLSPAGHLAWTGLAAAALFAAAGSGWRPRAVAGAGGAAVLAVALHAAWDGAPTVAVRTGVALAGLVALGLQARRAGREQRAGALTDPGGAPRSTRPSPAGR